MLASDLRRFLGVGELVLNLGVDFDEALHSIRDFWKCIKSVGKNHNTNMHWKITPVIFHVKGIFNDSNTVNFSAVVTRIKVGVEHSYFWMTGSLNSNK